MNSFSPSDWEFYAPEAQEIHIGTLIMGIMVLLVATNFIYLLVKGWRETRSDH